jgi:cytochrome P450
VNSSPVPPRALRIADEYQLQFGYGSRTCVGRNLATFEVYKFIAQLITRYNVELLNPSNPWTVRSSWFAEMDNLHIRLKRRVRSLDALVP